MTRLIPDNVWMLHIHYTPNQILAKYRIFLVFIPNSALVTRPYKERWHINQSIHKIMFSKIPGNVHICINLLT